MKQPVSDAELLRRYVADGDQEAFARLLQEHINLVYSAALRQMGDQHAAEDVTQAVFIILARKAAAVHGGALPGWLIHTARLVAMNARRLQARRRFHEREAAEMKAAMLRIDSSWEKLCPLLDEGLTRLGPKERSAIVLRFYQQKSTAETAAALEISEDAAGMRIRRGLEKLRRFFVRRGVVLPVTALGGVISVNAVHAAPPSLASLVSTSALASLRDAIMPGDVAMMVNETLRGMSLAKAKATALVALSVVAILSGILAMAYWIVHAPAGGPLLG